MIEYLLPYEGLLAANAALAALVMIQVLVQDFAGIKAKHVPGMPVTAGHSSFHFRAVRAHANTNEQLPVWILMVVLAILLGADAVWATRAAWLFTAARLGHMTFYYLDQRLARSVSFGLGLLAQFMLLVLCGLAL